MKNIYRVWLGTLLIALILLGTLGCGLKSDSTTDLHGSTLGTKVELMDDVNPNNEEGRLAEDGVLEPHEAEASKNAAQTGPNRSQEAEGQQNEADEQQVQVQSTQPTLEQQDNNSKEGTDQKQTVSDPTQSKQETNKGLAEKPKEDHPQHGQDANQKPSGQEQQDSEGQSESQGQLAHQAVTFTIIGPEDVGTILEDTEIEFKEGETVLDTLKRVTKEHKIQMEYRGRKGMAYIEGIHNIYEFDYGAESGWLYSVNGVFPNRGAGVWPVEVNDHIRWLYTVDLGRDWDAYIPEVEDTD